LFYRVVVALKVAHNVVEKCTHNIRESLVWDRRFGWFLLIINSVSSRESTCNIAACIATSSTSCPGYYAPPLSTPLIPRRRHERSTAPPLLPSSMPSVFLDIKVGMPTVSQSLPAMNRSMPSVTLPSTHHPTCSRLKRNSVWLQ